MCCFDSLVDVELVCSVDSVVDASDCRCMGGVIEVEAGSLTDIGSEANACTGEAEMTVYMCDCGSLAMAHAGCCKGLVSIVDSVLVLTVVMAGYVSVTVCYIGEDLVVGSVDLVCHLIEPLDSDSDYLRLAMVEVVTDSVSVVEVVGCVADWCTANLDGVGALIGCLALA